MLEKWIFKYAGIFEKYYNGEAEFFLYRHPIIFILESSAIHTMCTHETFQQLSK